jgi:hypothetical protein
LRRVENHARGENGSVKCPNNHSPKFEAKDKGLRTGVDEGQTENTGMK